MQTNIRKFISLLPILALSSASAFAANGGVIHFVGQIVETPCAYQPSSQQIRVNCYNAKTGNTERAIPINALLQGQTISDETSIARLQWVDRAKNLAILNVEYK